MRNKTSNKYFIYDHPRKTTISSFFRNVILLIINAMYRIIYTFKRRKTAETKYDVSICAIFKDESPYLKEWIEYHKIVGVDHFFLYNNLSSDDYHSVLDPYIAAGVVDLIEWPYPQTQLKAYDNCMKTFGKTSKWIGFIDIDEFVVPKSTDDIYSFLKNFEKYPSVLVYWKLFGSSGRIQRDPSGLVTQDFYCCWPKYDEVGKCFFNTAYELDPEFRFNSIFHHFSWGKQGRMYFPPVNIFGYICSSSKRDKANNADFPIQINHYFTKSYEEYLEKRSKGDVFFKDNPHNMDYFYRHEIICTSTDFSAYKYLVKLKLAMGIGS